MTKQLQNLLIIAMMFIIGVGSYQIIKISSDHKELQQQYETAIQNQKECMTQNKQLSFDLETKDNEIQELQKELYSIKDVRRYQIVALAKEAVKLGWQSRGMPGMTLEATLKKIDEIK